MDQRRRCFWEDIANKLDKTKYEVRFKSISDSIGKENPAIDLFNKKLTDIIIVNWDAINGDPVLGSDIAYNFFQHYVPDLDEWVSLGGVILVENQSMAWLPSKNVYNLFSKYGNFPVILNMDRRHGQEVSKNKKESYNPILKGLADCLNLDNAQLYKEEWFPQQFGPPVTPSLDHIKTQNKRIYSGYFKSWNKEWKPLLFGDSSKNAVMLFRTVSKSDNVGAYIISTMHIASSELISLIKNIFDFPENAVDYINENIKRKRKAQRTRFTSILIGAAVGFVVILAIYFLKPQLSLTDSAGIVDFASKVLSGTISGIASGALIYFLLNKRKIQEIKKAENN